MSNDKVEDEFNTVMLAELLIATSMSNKKESEVVSVLLETNLKNLMNQGQMAGVNPMGFVIAVFGTVTGTMHSALNEFMKDMPATPGEADREKVAEIMLQKIFNASIEASLNR
ncbi:MAG: hypothetical protein KUG81_04190 [Gammaproteobacteria bacterium]|nr:hypothetical protein [Gammaproteobacteria bacterium]